MSGLYGVLRRWTGRSRTGLEMGTALKVGAARNLTSSGAAASPST
jgi:hypothetical protein